jgi:hypothetical protein
MLSRRRAGCGAWRREDWLSFQAARRSLRVFWTSPRHFKFNTLRPVLSVRMPSSLLKAEYIHVLSPRAVRRLDRRPVCLPRSSKPGTSMYPPRVRRRPCGLRTDRTGDARAEWIRASLDPHSAYRCHIFSDILHRTIAQSVMPAFLTMQNTHVQAPLASPHAACQRCHAAKR